MLANLDLAADVLDASIAQSRPRYLAYIGSSGLEVGALADLLAHSYDINLALDAGGATRLERQATEWLAAFLGFPAMAGFFTSGGTISNITALAAAREHALPGSRSTGMAGRSAALYCSAEAHYSVTRAAELLGVGRDNVRAIAIDERRRMSPRHLAEQVDADLAAGIVPIAVVATAGTTLTGAVDPIGPIADVCADRGVWLHVDGAYGLPAAAAASTAGLFAGLDRVDSMSVDAHKWLFVPKACGAVLVRRTSDLAAAFSHNEAYIPHEDDELNAVDVTLEFSRPFRALKLWLALRVHGAAAFRSAIEENLAQARLLHSLATAHPDFQTLAHPPMLSIVPIRHLPPGCRSGPARRAAVPGHAAGRARLRLARGDRRPDLAAAVLHQLPDHRGRRAHDADGRGGDRRESRYGGLTAVGYPPRMAEDARASSEGVTFPEGGDGRRSTTATGRAVFADSVRAVDPALAARIEHTSDWRTGYIAPLRDIVRAAAITPSAAIAVSEDGLESARRRFSFGRNGVHVSLPQAMDRYTEPGFGSVTVRGMAPPRPRSPCPTAADGCSATS